MEAKNVFDAFLTDLKSSFSGIEVSEYSIDEEVKRFEKDFYPSAMKVFTRDETLFDEPRTVFGIDISPLWKSSEGSRDAIWKHLMMCTFSSFLHGDIKEKIGSLVGIVKNAWSESGQENDEISKILSDENVENHFQEILEYLQNTRIAKLITSIAEEIDVEEFVGDINFDNPQELIESLKNPDHPMIKKAINKVKDELEKRMKRGDITQNQILGEIEGIKQKVQSIFGNVINDMLGMKKGETPTSVLMGNSPEARRQRMLARLQKKQREKTSY